MANKLLSNLSLYTLGQFLSQALSFILLPLYIMYLSKEDYGIVASFMAVGTFLNALMQYGFNPSLLRYYYEYKENPKCLKSFFSSLLLFMLAGNLIIAIVLFLFKDSIFGYILPNIDFSEYIGYIIGYSFCFTLPLLSLTIYRAEGKAKKYLIFNISQFLISFSFIYFFVVLQNGGALGKVKGEFWARIPLFLISFFLYRKYFTLHGLSVLYIKKALNFGIPLLLQAILWWGLYRLDYFLIGNELGSEQLGLYNVAFQISFILITIGISFSLAWTPHFFSIAMNKDTPKLYGNLLGNYFMFLSLLCICVYFWGYYILKFIGGENYIEIFKFLPFLLIGAFFQSSYYLIHQTIQYSKKTWSIPIVLLGGILIGIILEYLLISDYGLLGISIIKTFIFISVFVITFHIGQKHYSIKIPSNKLLIALGMLTINLTIGYNLDYSPTSLFVKIIVFTCSLLGLWFVFPFFEKDEKELIAKKIATIYR